MVKLRRFPLELVCWTGGLLTLFFSEVSGDSHFTLCPLYNLGLDWCPGCGLGRSIASILKGDISASIKFHWFGIPALIILLHRIFYLFRNFRLTLMLYKA